MNYITTTKRSF